MYTSTAFKSPHYLATFLTFVKQLDYVEDGIKNCQNNFPPIWAFKMQMKIIILNQILKYARLQDQI